jgi:hypothetical protein
MHNWYLDTPLDTHTRSTLSQRQLSERAAWRHAVLAGSQSRRGRARLRRSSKPRSIDD